MRDERVETWHELSDRLYELSWNAGLNRLRSNFVYRGMPDCGSDLSTSLTRLGGPYWELEAAVLASFRKYAQDGAQAVNSVWDWLALAQHQGLPTQMLDWTCSPYVALQFMTEAAETYGAGGVL